MQSRSAPRTLSPDTKHVVALRALSHADRLRVFFLIVKARGEIRPEELKRASGLSGPTLSRHLDVLRRSGLLASRREGRFIHYSMRRELVSDLVRLLTACC